MPKPAADRRTAGPLSRPGPQPDRLQIVADAPIDKAPAALLLGASSAAPVLANSRVVANPTAAICRATREPAALAAQGDHRYIGAGRLLASAPRVRPRLRQNSDVRNRSWVRLPRTRRFTARPEWHVQVAVISRVTALARRNARRHASCSGHTLSFLLLASPDPVPLVAPTQRPRSSGTCENQRKPSRLLRKPHTSARRNGLQRCRVRPS